MVYALVYTVAGAVLAPPLWEVIGGQGSSKWGQSPGKFMSVMCTNMQFLT